MARGMDGFVFTALPQSSTQNLERLARAYTRYAGGPEVTFRDWDTALDAVLRLGEGGGRNPRVPADGGCRADLGP